MQCNAAQVLLGGKPGQCTRMHSIIDEKCNASSVLAMDSVQRSSHMTPLRHVEENRHLAKSVVQLLRTQRGLGFKVDESMGQPLMQPSVSSTVLFSSVAACRSIVLVVWALATASNSANALAVAAIDEVQEGLWAA